MPTWLQLNRTEISGSLGDLGTLLPLGMGLIVINQLDPTGIFFTIGLYYIFSGLYFRVTSPVEPMKVISGYAIAASVTASQIQASCLWVFAILLMIGFYAVIAKLNLIKKLIGLSLFQAAVFLLYITMGNVEGASAPIFGFGAETFSNPLPQVLILTAIVVGISTMALGLGLVVRIKEEYGSIEEDEIQEIDRR